VQTPLLALRSCGKLLIEQLVLSAVLWRQQPGPFPSLHRRCALRRTSFVSLSSFSTLASLRSRPMMEDTASSETAMSALSVG
jgi:hypothetical protein